MLGLSVLVAERRACLFRVSFTQASLLVLVWNICKAVVAEVTSAKELAATVRLRNRQAVLASGISSGLAAYTGPILMSLVNFGKGQEAQRLRGSRQRLVCESAEVP